MNRMLRFARIGLRVAGLFFLLDTLFGLFAMLGIGFNTLQDVLAVLCVTMAFPIFLSGFYSLGAAVILLWSFFFAQWIDQCFLSPGGRFEFVSPFDWFYGDTLFAAVVIVQLAYLALRRVGYSEYVTLRGAFEPPESETR